MRHADKVGKVISSKRLTLPSIVGLLPRGAHVAKIKTKPLFLEPDWVETTQILL